MSLAWIAAVLQPRDVARHPNFRHDEANRDGPARLAGIVLGGEWSSETDPEIEDSETLAFLSLVEECLRPGTIVAAVPRLVARLDESPPDDVAMGAALSLIACGAAVELDDFASALRVLDGQLARLVVADSPDRALIRATLVQQRALRSRDAGQAYVDQLTEVGALLEYVNPRRCSQFRTSAGVAWDSAVTIQGIRTSLLHAASSLWPSDAGKPVPPLLDRFELVRQPPAPLAVRRLFESEKEYSRFVEQRFAGLSESGGRRFGGPAEADLFHSAMLAELAGSGSVYEARKDLALLRIVGGADTESQIADAVRLLRHAGAKGELERQLRRLEAGGPLAALSADARQIIRMRLDPTLLRTLEVKVLTSASEILTATEAEIALAAVAESLSVDGPPSPAGRWELAVVRRGVAWSAVAALAQAAEAEDMAAQLLLDEVTRVSEDMELADREMRRAVVRMDWSRVSVRLTEAWRAWVDEAGTEFPGVAEAVASRLGGFVAEELVPSDWDRLVNGVNARLRGVDVPPPFSSGMLEMVRERLNQRRSEVASGTFSFGGVEEADVAAALAVLGEGDALWPDLTAYLTDPRVPRDFRSRALDRLADSAPDLPESSRSAFAMRKEALLAGVGPGPFDAGLTPYPAALRFLASYGLLERAEVYGELATLAGSSAATARREAAETVSVLARRAPAEEMLALALPLSHDADVEVRARAGKALASLATYGGVLARAAERRALQLLDQDGLRVPLLVLRSLADASTVPPSILERVRNLALRHPSRAVRRAAAEVGESPSLGQSPIA